MPTQTPKALKKYRQTRRAEAVIAHLRCSRCDGKNNKTPFGRCVDPARCPRKNPELRNFL